MKIMAIDYGDARTGFAISDRSEFLASPIGTVPERNAERLADKAAQTAAEYGAGEIIVGLPINMNGTEGPRAEKCRAFAELLKERTDLPVGRALHYRHSTQYPQRNKRQGKGKKGCCRYSCRNDNFGGLS